MRTLALILLCLAAFPQEAPWTPFGEPDNRVQPPRTSVMDVEHYRIQVRVDDVERRLEASCDIRLTLTAEAERIELDAEDMKVRRVVGLSQEMSFHHEKGRLTVELGGRKPKGEKVRLIVEYIARPTAGWFFIGPDKGYPFKPRMTWTQGETIYNRRWFPCYDDPSDFATFEFMITVREPHRSVANGELVSTRAANGHRTEIWKTEKPMATYLASVITGDLDVVEETVELGDRKIPLWYAAPKGMHTEEEMKHAFGRTAAMMKFFSAKTGVPYPWEKYAQTIAVDFTWGGMENTSATTLHAYTVTPKRAWGDRDSDGLIAHELAHQWFGDLVTCKSWGHIWLNEGFATYFDALWDEETGGREALVESLQGGLGWVLGQFHEYQRPTVCDCYTHPDDVFDSVAYPRGAWVLHMLRTQLGDEAWWKGVKHYLTKHAHQPVTTEDFRKAMEEATGKDLGAFFNQWVYAVGHPELKASWEWDEAAKKVRLTIAQTQPVKGLAFQTLKTERPLFKFGMDVEVETPDERKLHRIEVSKAEEVFEFPCAVRPSFLNVDRDMVVLKSLELEMEDAALEAMLTRDDQAWWRAWAAGQLGQRKKVDVLAKAFDTEESPSVLAAILEARKLPLKGAIERLEALAARRAGTRAAERYLQLRPAAVRAMDADPVSLIEKGVTPGIQAAAAEALGAAGQESFAKLKAAAEKFAGDEIVLAGVVAGLRAASHPDAGELFVRFSAYGQSPGVRRAAVEGLGAWFKEHKDAPKAKDAFDALVGLMADPEFRTRRAAIQQVAEIGDAGAEDALKARLDTEPEGRLKRAIGKALRKIAASRK